MFFSILFLVLLQCVSSKTNVIVIWWEIYVMASFGKRFSSLAHHVQITTTCKKQKNMPMR